MDSNGGDYKTVLGRFLFFASFILLFFGMVNPVAAQEQDEEGEAAETIDGVVSTTNLSLRDILESEDIDLEIDIESTELSNVSLLDAMSLEDFLEVFPEYQDTNVADFPILSESFASAGQESSNNQENSADQAAVLSEAQSIFDENPEITTSELLEAIPELGDTSLSDLPLEDLTVGDIEGLADINLENISEIYDQYLSQIESLSESSEIIAENSEILSEANSQDLLIRGDVLGRLDIPYAGEEEYPKERVVTGGTRDQIFRPEPCYERSCKHFEVVDPFGGGVAGFLNGLGSIDGKGWIQGSSQQVPGGKGALQAVNNGMERTGISIWGPETHIKLSLEDIDEGGNGEPSTAQVWLDVQICVVIAGTEHCTPHFISFPTPLTVESGAILPVFSRTSPSELN